MNALSATASSAAASGAGAAGSHYNPAAVMTAAHAQLAAGDWEGGQFLFQSSLLEWTDDVREGGAGESSTTTAISAEEEQQREAIATLWLGYAQYLVDAKQYKSATRAYDDAMKATKAVGRVHAAAALYALERNQRQTAIRIYRNALVGNTNTNNNSTAAAAAVQDEHDREILWRDFLHMMQESHPNLTMAELQASASTAAAEFGVVAENDNATPTIGATTGSASSSNTIPNHTAATATTEWNQNDTVDRNNNTSTNITNNVNDTDDSRQPPGKRIKLWQSENTNNEPRGNGTALPSGTTDNTTTKTHVVTYESVQELQQEYQTKVFLCRNNNTGLENQTQPHHPSSSSSDPPFSLPPDVMAAWMSRDGHGLPLEPPSPSLFGPSPPKLSDPTGKDILGVGLAVKLVQRLLSPSGAILLETCRGLWMLQAWTEKTCRMKVESHDASLLAQHEQLEKEWEARWSAAGNAATADAVAQMNNRERENFQWNASQKRQHVISQTVWELRQLLFWQQTALVKLQVPGFTDDDDDDEGLATMIDADSLLHQSYICQYLHSAFYIRNRMGHVPHETMLRSQLKKLLREQQTSAANDGGGTHSTKMMPMYQGEQQQASVRRQQLSPVPPLPPPQSYHPSAIAQQQLIPQIPYNGNAFQPQQHQQGYLHQGIMYGQQGQAMGMFQPQMQQQQQQHQQLLHQQQQQQQQQQQYMSHSIPQHNSLLGPHIPVPPPPYGTVPQYPYYQ